VRLAILFAILASLIVSLVTGIGSASNETAGDPTTPSLTPVQKTAAMRALERILPPAGFRRYEQWPVGTSPRSPAVACLSAPAICFGSTTPLPPLTNRSGRALLVRFGVRSNELACDPLLPGRFHQPVSSCLGYGSFAGYKLGIMLTVLHFRFPDQRSGTQVVLFVTRPK
jgi:hypothetical protein